MRRLLLKSAVLTQDCVSCILHFHSRRITSQAPQNRLAFNLLAGFYSLRPYHSTGNNSPSNMISDSARVPENNHAMNGCIAGSNGDCKQAEFNPKRVLVLTKLSRLEFEEKTNPTLNQSQLELQLRARGSDYMMLLQRHQTHHNYLKALVEELNKRGVENRVVHRWNFDDANINWCDAVMTAGGDGTFLLAASKINHDRTPVIGINTDPVSSEGYLCLIKKLPESQLSSAFDRLWNGQFEWLRRQRIRVTLSGPGAWSDPLELHDQQLMYPEYRWSEHVKEHEEARLRSSSRLTSASTCPTLQHQILRPHSATYPLSTYNDDQLSPSLAQKRHPTSYELGDSSVFMSPETTSESPLATHRRRTLPVLALNEVFIGESLSSRVSYYELCVDGGTRVKQKSSGITVCTGTGSTSWNFNINKMTDQCVSDLLSIVSEHSKVKLPANDSDFVNTICQKWNSRLIFGPEETRMAFTIRDPVYNATFSPIPPRGFAKNIQIKSRCFDAHLVIDGGLSYIFNDGAEATLELKPEDALRTVIFR